jgi:phenylalanyl-tRNA synthetase alpha subunit
VEGLYINKERLFFADLKHDLFFFASEMFGEETQIRLRPSYFPFTEPSAEMDVSCNICQRVKGVIYANTLGGSKSWAVVWLTHRYC